MNRLIGSGKAFLKRLVFPTKAQIALYGMIFDGTWNVEAQNYKGVDEKLRAQQLGHSLTVNQRHYSGNIDDELQKVLSKLKSATGDNLIPFIQKERMRNNG